jgi:hypothetical protein
VNASCDHLFLPRSSFKKGSSASSSAAPRRRDTLREGAAGSECRRWARGARVKEEGEERRARRCGRRLGLWARRPRRYVRRHASQSNPWANNGWQWALEVVQWSESGLGTELASARRLRDTAPRESGARGPSSSRPLELCPSRVATTEVDLCGARLLRILYLPTARVAHTPPTWTAIFTFSLHPLDS